MVEELYCPYWSEYICHFVTALIYSDISTFFTAHKNPWIFPTFQTHFSLDSATCIFIKFSHKIYFSTTSKSLYPETWKEKTMKLMGAYGLARTFVSIIICGVIVPWGVSVFGQDWTAEQKETWVKENGKWLIFNSLSSSCDKLPSCEWHVYPFY